jgi:hypothetical protein
MLGLLVARHVLAAVELHRHLLAVQNARVAPEVVGGLRAAERLDTQNLRGRIGCRALVFRFTDTKRRPSMLQAVKAHSRRSAFITMEKWW